MAEEKKKIEDIELRSEAFQEILGNVPPWILRIGISVIAFILAILLIGSAIFKYPDTISTTMELTGSTPTSAVVARSTGKIKELYITNEQTVKEQEYLAIIDNPASTKDVLLLKQFMQQLDIVFDSIVAMPPKDLSLGNIQSLYSSFYITLYEYNEFLRLRYYTQKIDFMKNRIHQYTDYYKNVAGQRKIVEDQMTLNKSQFQRDSLLHQKGVISTEQLENTHGQYLQSRLSIENIITSIQNTEIQLNQLKENLLDTEYQYFDKKNQLETQLKTYISQLYTEIQAWELNYVLASPIAGKVTFTNYWVQNQNINAGETAFTIIPNKVDHILGKAQMPISRSGKVKAGQKVNIRFANFPDNEYGMVKGIVKQISLVPSVDKEGNNYYTVEVELPNGLNTTYQKTLPYMMDMQAQADIITEDMSVLERFFLPLRKIWTEGMNE